MTRPPSKHGLERKYKPWRRGKSNKVAKRSRSSLKNQLRGKERLLAKVSDDGRRAELQASILLLKEEMAKSAASEKQRKHAVQSHGTRFLERQRLTRMERATRKLREQCNGKDRYDQELFRIALDQVFVAHFPHDAKYLSLFRKGERVVDKRVVASKRASIRQRILQLLSSEETERVAWIARDQYERVPKKWSLELEQLTFGTAEAASSRDKESTGDNRFSLNTEHDALVEAAEKLDAKIDKEISAAQSKPDDSSIDSSEEKMLSDNEMSSGSDLDDADPLRSEGRSLQQPTSPQSSSSSSSGEETSSSSSSSSSRSDEESSDEDDIRKQQVPTSIASMKVDDTSEDDFFAPDDDGHTNVFENAKEEVAKWDHSKGDKSKGWATQRQRPDQRKRQRTRR